MMHFNLEAYFNIQVRDSKTLALKRETGRFKNLITDFGLNRLGTGGVIGGVAVGSGTNPPTNSDTQLQIFVASTSTVQNTTDTVSGAPEYYSAMIRTYRFSEGAAAGNLSEVGVIIADSPPYNLWSRTLIRDSAGNPVTITVLPNEILDVIYECRMYPVLTDVVGGPVSLLGVNYNWAIRSLQVNTSSARGFLINGASGTPPGWTAYDGPLAAVTAAAPSGSVAGTGTATKGAYINNSYSQRIVASWGISAGNEADGIRSFAMYLIDVANSPRFQIAFDKTFPKNSTNTLSITFDYSWGRRTV